jgi:hypothetical protein
VISAHNFSEHVFSWYVKQGKQGRLLLATGRSNELGRFVPVIQIFMTCVLDPDPHGTALILVGCIRIQVGKSDFSCVLDDLHEGLGINII